MPGDTFDDGTLFDDGNGWVDTVVRQMLRRRWKFHASAGAGGQPLDSYTTNLWGAWSTRKLLTSYGGAPVRGYRSSDTAEQDLAFSGNDLDASALAAGFGAGAVNIFSKFIYDQSGNSRDMKMATASKMPRISASGTVQTQNGKASLVLVDATGTIYTDAVGADVTGTVLSAYYVGSLQSLAYCRALTVFTDAIEDNNNAATAAVLLRDASTSNLLSFRNSTALAGGTVSFSALGTVFAAGVRYDGSNVNIRRGSSTASAAVSSTFGWRRVGLAAQGINTPQGASGQVLCEAGVWTSDIGDTAMQAILTNAVAYWAAI